MESIDFSRVAFRDIARLEKNTKNEFNIYFTMGSYCPLHCSYCTQGEHHDYKDFDEALELAGHFHKLAGYVSQRKEEGLKVKLHLIGGEPIYYPITEMVERMAVPYDELYIISNFIRPNSYYDAVDSYCREHGRTFQVQVSLHTNKVPIGFYEKKIASALPKGYIRDLIYVVEEDAGKLGDAIALSRKLGVFTELHRMRQQGNLPMEGRVYSDEIERRLLSYEKETGLRQEFHAVATLKDGSQYEMPALGDLSTYYPFDDLYGLYCDIPQHSIRVNQLGNIGLAPVCKAFLTDEEGRVLNIRTCGELDDLKASLPPYVRCGCPVCPMNAKKVLLRGFPKEGIRPAERKYGVSSKG